MELLNCNISYLARFKYFCKVLNRYILLFLPKIRFRCTLRKSGIGFYHFKGSVIVFTPSEVGTLSIGKASGPNGLSNGIIHMRFLIHSGLCLSSHYKLALYQLPIKRLIFALSLKKEIYLWFLIIDRYHCLRLKAKYLKS